MRPARPVLRFGARDLVVVAGLPGSGKSRLLRRLTIHGRSRVLDPEQVAAALRWAVARAPFSVPYRAYRPLVHAGHWARVVAFALASPGAVLVHATGTRRWQLTLFRLLAALSRRRERYLWLDVDPAVAYASTYLRGRPHRPDEFARHVRRASRVRLAGRPDVTVVDRGWADARPLLVLASPDGAARQPLSPQAQPSPADSCCPTVPGA